MQTIKAYIFNIFLELVQQNDLVIYLHLNGE